MGQKRVRTGKRRSPRSLPKGDYVSPGLEVVRPDAAFRHLIVGDRSLSAWPFLRRDISHNWYVDSRDPTIGFLSRDEAAILYNTALHFKGKACLEIGCWRGWSTVHLALGSGNLEIIDPVFFDADFAEDVRGNLERAGVLDSITIHAGRSPGAVRQIVTEGARRWSLIFVDGDHDGDAPRRDAEAVAEHAEADALVLFHDLVSPHVAAGLAFLRELGWRTMIYQTMQIMGVAWRGNVQPVVHVPDPDQSWTLPAHLSGYDVSPAGAEPVRAAPAGEPAAAPATPAQGDTRNGTEALEEEIRATRDSLQRTLDERGELLQKLQDEHTATEDLRRQLTSLGAAFTTAELEYRHLKSELAARAAEIAALLPIVGQHNQAIAERADLEVEYARLKALHAETEERLAAQLLQKEEASQQLDRTERRARAARLHASLAESAARESEGHLLNDHRAREAAEQKVHEIWREREWFAGQAAKARDELSAAFAEIERMRQVLERSTEKT